MIRRNIALTIGLLLAAAPAMAQKHRLQRIGDNSMDLVVTLDWDPLTSTPNRAYLDEAFRRFGDDVNRSTQGLVRVCKLYVYAKRRQAGKADMLVSREGRRPASTLSGLRVSAARMNMYTADSRNSALLESRLGRLMAHELGHYAFGTKDEYTETEHPEPRSIESTRTCDVRLGTLMGSAASADFSTPIEYTAKDFSPWKPRAGQTVDLSSNTSGAASSVPD